MKTLSYRKIDAFTSDNSLGNPAACVYLSDEQTLTEDEMLSIAKQHKGFVSEVVYCTAKEGTDFNLVYYSSECEVPFCGHGTIACMYSLIKSTPELLSLSEINIHTRTKGSLIIYNKIAEQDKTLDNEGNIFPNEQTLKDFSLNNDIDVILIFCMDTKDKSHFAHTRVFAAKYGYLEDPATGSANSAFGYYLLKNNMWDGNPITLEQGSIDRVFNIVHLSNKDNNLLFGGRATTRINGVYYGSIEAANQIEAEALNCSGEYVKQYEKIKPETFKPHFNMH